MSGAPQERQPPSDGRAINQWTVGAHQLGPQTAWLDQFPGGVFQLRLDRDGCWSFPFINLEAQRLLGMSAAALRRDARATEAVLRAVDLVELKTHLYKSRETGLPWKARVQVQRHSGCGTWVDIMASPQSCLDASTVWNGFLMNVDYEEQRRRALHHLHETRQHVIRAAALGMVEIDLSTRMLSLDAAARRQHGLDASQAMLSESQWLDLFLPDDRALAQLAWTAPLGNEGQSAPSVLLHLKRASRTGSHALEITITAGPSGNEAALRADAEMPRWGICRDVAVQPAQQDQHAALSAGVLAERDRRDFLSRVSHELRTPLNGILGYAQLMVLDREHPLPQAQLHRVRVLQESGTRLLSMIDQLLTIRGIDQGEIALHPEVVDVVPLIARCVGHVQSFAQARSIDIDVGLIDEQIAYVRADPKALEQVLHALLSNAIKFNRSPGRVRIRFVSAEMGTIIIDDTGMGLNSKKLSQLFQPLNRLGAERDGIPGRGLGLITARKLTQAMGGTLRAWSQVGTGSRFAVSLALAKPQRSVGTPESEFSSFESTEREGDLQRVVLYIEDDEVNTALMEQVFLMHPEWRLLTATNGEHGILAAIAHQPELILIDIGLPDMSGVEVLKRIKADGRTQSTRCVALSADASVESVHRAHAAGFEEYWTKPFDILGMVNQLKALLD